MNVPVKLRGEAIDEGVAMAALRGKDLSAEDVRAIVNAVLAMQGALSPKLTVNMNPPAPRVVFVPRPPDGRMGA